MTMQKDELTIAVKIQRTEAEVEDIINFQPLTYVGLVPAMEEALTLNYFVREEREEERSVPPAVLRDRYKQSQRLANTLWARWMFGAPSNHQTADGMAFGVAVTSVW